MNVQDTDAFCHACGVRILNSQGRASTQDSRPNTFSLTVSIERQSTVLGFKSYSLLLNGIELFDDLQMGEIRKIELPIGKNSVQVRLNCTALNTFSPTSNIVGFTAEPSLSYFMTVRFERSRGSPKIAFTAPDGTLLEDAKNSSSKMITYSLVALAFGLVFWAFGASRNTLPPLTGTPVHEGNEPASLATNGLNFQPKLSISLQTGMEYKWFNDGSCTSREREICITEEDYKALCLSASGATKMASGMLTTFNRRANYLLDNGNIDELTVSWRDGHTYGCRVIMQVSGMFQGSSARERLDGGITTFIFNQEGKVLAHSASDTL